MQRDYAKEIATRALSIRHGDGDRGLLSETIRFAFNELATMATANELIALLDELSGGLREPA